MPHLDPDRLVLLALDEAPVDPTESGHVAACDACRAEVDDLRVVAALGAETQEVRELPAPPERVWRGIVAELRVHEAQAATTDRPARRGRALAGAWTPAWTPSRAAGRAAGQLRLRGWLRPALAGAVAAVLAVAGTLYGVGVVDGTGGPDRPGTAPPVVTAQAALSRLPTAPATVSGDARVLAGDGGGGADRLHLHVTGLPLSTGYYEVWLIDPASGRMISVGTLGRYADALLPLPSTVDINAYRVVDVSVEAYDGQVAHSGQSLLRGALTG